MNFLSPLFLLGALAVALPIALHLLRRDIAPAVPFSAVRLLNRSPVERSKRRRLRDLLLLAARVIALLLLAVAFARPFAPGSAATIPLQIIGLDRSFSMGAPDTFERALALARHEIDNVPFGARVAVIAFDDGASVVAPPGGTGEARAALDSVSPGYGATAFDNLLRRSVELAAGAPARLVVVSDLRRHGWRDGARVPIPSSMAVDIRQVEAAPDNVAITNVRAGESAVTVTIRNAGEVERKGIVTIQRAGREIGRADWTAAGGVVIDAAIPWRPAPGPLLASLTDKDGFPADDTRYADARGPGGADVAILTSRDAPGVYVREALVAASAGRAWLLPRTLPAGGIGTAGLDALSRARVIVLLSTRGLDRATRDAIPGYVRAGAGLVIAASPSVEPSVLSSMFGWGAAAFTQEPARDGSLVVIDSGHPVFRPFGAFGADLGGVRFTRAWGIEGDGWQVPARFDDGSPALVERREERGRVVVFASDLDRGWNEFPVDPTFVPFVAEVVAHAGARATAGEYLAGQTPAGVASEPGVHQAADGATVVVNVDPGESAVGAMSVTEFASMLEPARADAMAAPAAAAAQIEAGQGLWRYGLVLMLGALVVEALIGRVHA